MQTKSKDTTIIWPANGVKNTQTMEKEMVDHPNHYGGKTNIYEAIKVIEAWELDFHLGNTVKYISRAGKKNIDKEIEDLEKALWYLSRKINYLKESKNAQITT